MLDICAVIVWMLGMMGKYWTEVDRTYISIYDIVERNVWLAKE